MNWAKEVEEARPTTIHTYNAWIAETGRHMIIDPGLENFGLPAFTNTKGLDDLKLQSFPFYPGLMDIGHGYHLTTNPNMVLGWAEQWYTPLPVQNWEELFVSHPKRPAQKKDWREMCHL